MRAFKPLAFSPCPLPRGAGMVLMGGRSLIQYVATAGGAELKQHLKVLEANDSGCSTA